MWDSPWPVLGGLLREHLYIYTRKINLLEPQKQLQKEPQQNLYNDDCRSLKKAPKKLQKVILFKSFLIIVQQLCNNLLSFKKNRIRLNPRKNQRN